MPRDFIPGRHEPDTPSNTFSYFTKEAFRRIWASKRISFVAIAMIAISLYILGAFLLVAENLDRAVRSWQGRSRMNVYFTTDATQEQIAAVDAFLAARPETRQRRFVTRDEALATFKASFASLADVAGDLATNPFPPSYQVEVSPEILRTAAVGERLALLRKMPGVEEVQLDWEWLTQLRRLVDFFNVAGVVAGGILALAAAFTIANVIRLTMLLYREEVDIMRLVGATERIIRGPFLIEGLLQGTIGGILAVALLYGSFEASREMLAAPRSLLLGFLFAGFLPWQKVLALIVAGTAAGWIGSWLTVREVAE